MTDDQRAHGNGEIDAPDGRFLAELLGGVSRRARALESDLRALEQVSGADAARRSAELEREREVIGWGLLVAAGLVGADGAPARREVEGAAWLADLIELPEDARPKTWPRPRPAAADWVVAHVLVRWVWEAARHGGRMPVFEGTGPGRRQWSIAGADRSPSSALLSLVARAGAGARGEAIGGTWTLHLPGELFAGNGAAP